MFCPNCGAQNPDTSSTCQKCGFALKSAAGPKFKGTMLMMQGAFGAQAPGAPAGAVPPPGAAQIPGAPPAAGPVAQGLPAPAAEQAPQRARFKGTMIGVAPPAGGFQIPHAAPAPAQHPVAPPQAAPAPQAFSPHALPTQVQGSGPEYAATEPPRYGSLAPTGVIPAAAPQAAAPPTSAMAAFDAAPGFGLGGTMLAPSPGLAPNAGGRTSATPEIPVDLRDSAVLTPGSMSAPPAGAGAFGGSYPPAAGARPVTLDAPRPTEPGQYGRPSVAPSGAQFARFTERSPLVTALLVLVSLGIYAVLWFAWTADEMRAQNKQLPPSWHLIIPILGLIWVWKWCKALEELSQEELSATSSFLKLLLPAIGVGLLQSKLNDL